MLKPPIRIETYKRKNKGNRTVYVYKCSNPDCDKELRKRVSNQKTDMGKELCHRCVNRRRPFESTYITLKNSKRHKVDFTYEEFLEFTKIDKCHYCLDAIKWQPYAYDRKKYISRAYYLDRVNNDIHYTKENCVVCCTRCNRAKSNKFSYEEWFGMTSYLRQKKNIFTN